MTPAIKLLSHYLHSEGVSEPLAAEILRAALTAVAERDKAWQNQLRHAQENAFGTYPLPRKSSPPFPSYAHDWFVSILQRVRDWAAAGEREACAKVARDDLGSDAYLGGYSVQELQRFAAERIEKAILARK